MEGLIQTRVVDFFVLYIGYFHKLTPRPREGTLALELPNVRGEKSSSSAPWIIAQAKNFLSLIWHVNDEVLGGWRPWFDNRCLWPLGCGHVASTLWKLKYSSAQESESPSHWAHGAVSQPINEDYEYVQSSESGQAAVTRPRSFLDPSGGCMTQCETIWGAGI